jgi:hypothetical protein
MVKNKKLFKVIESAKDSVFEYYTANMVLDERHKGHPFEIFFAIQKLENQVQKIPKFLEAVQEMNSDNKITELTGKLVGTLSHASIVNPPEISLLLFINSLYLNKNELSDDKFILEYKSFEDYFYSDEIQIHDKTSLFNFEFSGMDILLEDGLKITLDSEKIVNQNYNLESNTSPLQSYLKSKHSIERIYKEKKINLNNSVEYLAAINSESRFNSSLIFDQIISSLRVLKASAIYRDHKIQSRSLTFKPYGAVQTTIPYYENKIQGAKCELGEHEVAGLMSIYKCIIIEKDSRFGVAIRRLTSGIERKNLEDRLIDYMIGLETLYLPDGTDELSFRLSLRVAFLLSTVPEERKCTFIFLRDMYKIRSNIVHGKNYELSFENVISIEELLRKSLKLWIINKKNFLAKVKNSIGSEDGKLNTIFFE